MEQKTILVAFPLGLRWSQVFRTREFVSSLDDRLSERDSGYTLQMITTAANRSISRGPLLFRTSSTFESLNIKPDLVIIPSIGAPLPENLWKNKAVTQFLNNWKTPILVIGTGTLLLPKVFLKRKAPHAFPRPFESVIQTLGLREYFDLRAWYTERNQIHSIAESNLLEYALTQWAKPWVSPEIIEDLRDEYHIRPPMFDQRIFRAFRPMDSHDDLMVLRAQTLLSEEYEQDWNMKELASQLYISRRQFDRRFRRATGYSAPEYLKMIRMDAAAKLLRKGPQPIEEITRNSGYMDTDAFRSVFKSFFGCTPTQYREFFQ